MDDREVRRQIRATGIERIDVLELRRELADHVQADRLLADEADATLAVVRLVHELATLLGRKRIKVTRIHGAP